LATQSVGRRGDFVFTKQYSIAAESANGPTVDVTGVIVQHVRRTTKIIHNGVLYNTTESINKLTSNHVLYSNDSYFEIFNVIQGESTSADAFGSGAVCEYGPDGPIIDADITLGIAPSTSVGTTIVRGVSFFIQSSNPIYPILLSCSTMPGHKCWITECTTPANGLMYLESTPETMAWMETIADKRDNTTLVGHKVVVNWNDDATHESYNLASSFIYDITK
jgi:hypothetical protein